MTLNSKLRVRSYNMPIGVFALFVIQVVSTLSFSVLYSTLVLYMKDKLGMEISIANSIMGVFIAFNYALHLLGGFWGGRLLSNRSLFCVGMLAQVIGCVLLASEQQMYLNYGLAAFLTGSGLNVTCLNCMLTQRFAPTDTRRETAFLWNYAGMNIGFFVGFSLSGAYQLTHDYQTLFLLSSLGNVIALFFCLFYWKQLGDIDTSFSRLRQSSKRKLRVWGMVCILTLPVLLSKMIQYASLANQLILLTGVVMMILIVWLALQQHNKEAKDKILAFAIFMLVSTVFWMLYQIGPMGLTLFIAQNVQRDYGSFIIPPQWFQNINTICIVIGGPVLGLALNKLRARGVQVNIPAQFFMSLSLIGLAFIILPIGIFFADSAGMVDPLWILASFVLQSLGELLISPIGYAMVGALAPSHLQGTMMGLWMLNSGVGATLASYSSNLMITGSDGLNPLSTNAGYSQVFMALGLFALFGSLVVYWMIPKLRLLTHEQQAGLGDNQTNETFAVSK